MIERVKIKINFILFDLVSEKTLFPRIEFRELESTDYSEIARIYNYYIENTTNTFHQRPFLPEEIPNLIPIHHPKYRTFVIIEKNPTEIKTDIQKIIGFCAIKAFSPRESYARTAEVVIYLDPLKVKKGLGAKALEYCEEYAKKVGIKVLLGSVSGENIASIRLFQKLGYMECGIFKQVGEKFGRILDVVHFQKFL